MWMCVCVCVHTWECPQSCLSLCDSMDYSPPGFSAHGIFQARILEWSATSYSQGSSQARDQTSTSCISCFGRQILYHQRHLDFTTTSPLDCKEVQPVHPKGNQSWIFIGRTDAEAEASILWPPDAKNWLIGKDPDAGKEWRPEERGTTEDEMVGWPHRPKGHEFQQASGVGDFIYFSVSEDFKVHILELD